MADEASGAGYSQQTAPAALQGLSVDDDDANHGDAHCPELSALEAKYDTLMVRKLELQEHDLTTDADARFEYTELIVDMDQLLHLMHAKRHSDARADSPSKRRPLSRSSLIPSPSRMPKLRSPRHPSTKSFAISFDDEGTVVLADDHETLTSKNSRRPLISPKRRISQKLLSWSLSGQQYSGPTTSPESISTDAAAAATPHPASGDGNSSTTEDESETLRQGVAAMEQKLKRLVAAGKFSEEDAEQILADAEVVISEGPSSAATASGNGAVDDSLAAPAAPAAPKPCSSYGWFSGVSLRRKGPPPEADGAEDCAEGSRRGGAAGVRQGTADS